jgi:hypothetical protein
MRFEIILKFELTYLKGRKHLRDQVNGRIRFKKNSPLRNRVWQCTMWWYWVGETMP